MKRAVKDNTGTAETKGVSVSATSPGPYELSVMLFDATGRAVRPVFSRKVPAEIGARVFDALTREQIGDAIIDAAEDAECCPAGVEGCVGFDYRRGGDGEQKTACEHYQQVLRECRGG